METRCIVESNVNAVEQRSPRKGGRVDIETKQEVLTRLAMGESQNAIARATGVSPSTVSNVSRKHGEVIRRLHESLLESLPTAVGTVKELVAAYADPYKRARMSSEERKQAFGFTMELLKSTGMLGGNQPAVLVQNFFQKNETVIIDPAVRDALGKYVEDIKKIGQEESNVIDIGESESQDADLGDDEGEAGRDEAHGGPCADRY